MATLFPDQHAFQPAYLALYETGELQRRAEQALAELADCHACPRLCGVDRLADESSVCKIGRYARVSTAFPHFGEEDCLRGWRGSGTIFFTGCNLRCVFCQNAEISQRAVGQEVTAAQLAQIMLDLQAQGCHNINFVTPEHIVPQILEALPLAIADGLRLPLVYNTAAYDAVNSLQLLDGIIDIYMPDFKLWDSKLARRYLKAPDYPAAARAAISEMHRQVGPLQINSQGLAQRGVLIRHLVMPGLITETEQIMQWLAKENSPDTYVNLMMQYYPAHQVNAEKYALLNRRLTGLEYRQAQATARQAGLHRFDKE